MCFTSTCGTCKTIRLEETAKAVCMLLRGFPSHSSIKEEIVPILEGEKDKVQPCKPILLFLAFLTPTWISLLKLSYSCVITAHNSPAAKTAWIAAALLCQDRVRLRNKTPKKNKVGWGGLFISPPTSSGSLMSIPESENTATTLVLWCSPRMSNAIKPACFWVRFCRFYTCVNINEHLYMYITWRQSTL